jgi:peptidoglycan-N-acetylglucosamine deacetylase
MIGELALAGGVAAAGALAHGAFYRNSPIFGSVMTHLPGAGRSIALTFDDGPNPETTPRVLDVLAAKGVRVTFFILGRHAERWPEIVRRVAAEGHQIGNHGYHHRKLHFMSPGYIRHDLTLGTQMIEAAGASAPRCFRAPHGFRNPWVTRIAAEMGQRTIGWSAGVWDSNKPGVDVIVRRAVKGLSPGGILLLHDGDGYDPEGDRTQTAAALPIVIDRLRDEGYSFQTLPLA